MFAKYSFCDHSHTFQYFNIASFWLGALHKKAPYNASIVKQLTGIYDKPQHKKHTFWHVCPMKTQTSLHIRAVWSVFDVHIKKHFILRYPKCTQWTFQSDCMNVQADRNLCWVLLFVLRFYGPVNQVGSCRARSVYLTKLLLSRPSSLSS